MRVCEVLASTGRTLILAHPIASEEPPVPKAVPVWPSELIAQESRALRARAQLAGGRLQAAVRGMQSTIDQMQTSLLDERPEAAGAGPLRSPAANENWGPIAGNGHG